MSKIDPADARKLIVDHRFREKIAQLNSLNLFVGDESFRNWDSQFQEDIYSLLKNLRQEVRDLVPDMLEQAYLMGVSAVRAEMR